MRISLILARDVPSYETLAVKFFQHFVYIAHAMKKRGHYAYELWDEEDGFFYDVLSHPNGDFSKFRVRSLVGLIPLYAVDVLTKEEIEKAPEFKTHFFWFLRNRETLTQVCVFPCSNGYTLSLATPGQLQRILQYVWDPNEFRSDFGLRSLSKYYKEHPFSYRGREISYEPGYSFYKIKGGNSNWRGPIWMPTMYLFIQSLLQFSTAFKDTFRVQGKGRESVDLKQMARDFAERAISLFVKGKEGIPPFFGSFPYAKDPHFSEHLFFHEYYHGETGEGLGASHQTGWSGLIANLIDEFRR